MKTRKLEQELTETKMGLFDRMNRIYGMRAAGMNQKLAFPSLRALRSENSLRDKGEKKGISPEKWFWPFFKIVKLEVASCQVDLLQNQRKKRRKFLQFLENFSGGISPLGWQDTERDLAKTEATSATDEQIGTDENPAF